MIKPLLRVLPSLSGNVKLACNITDVRKVDTNRDKDLWEGSVRGARLLPISSFMWQASVEANLIGSSWEYDLPKFYALYSDVFYKSGFTFDKTDMLKLDKHAVQKLRATDFEYGVKRISWKKNGKQYAFFAPIYIDCAECLPAYFEIEAKVYSTNQSSKTTYAVKKYLRVNIGNEIDSPRAYLGRYLDRYLKKIDDNVAFCMPLTNQATYYGIDLKHSGFVTAVDNMMDRVYHRQNTIHNFDATIAGAFERNRIAMKQILPLAFYFDVRDFMTEAEQIRYRNSYVEFSGAYYDAEGNELKKYDFSHDYMQYTEDVLRMNPMTGEMQWAVGECKNIMDVNFPSLNECRYVNYEYANKLAPWFCRWKMKYSHDDHPYVMNNSWAFSKNQNSNYKYGQFPSSFSQLLGLAIYIQEPKGTYNYDMKFPLGDPEDPESGRHLYKYAMTDGTRPGPYEYIAERYEQILDGYCTNWFSVVEEYDDSIYNDATLWEHTADDCVYYHGILYDLRNIYNLFTNEKHIDEFAVLIEPVMHVLTESEMNELRFSRATLYRQAVSQISSPNAVANDSLFTMSYLESVPDYAWADVNFNMGGKVNQDELRFNEIFRKNAYNTGNYIDLMSATYSVAHVNELTQEVSYTYSKYCLDYYDLDKYYTVQDTPKILDIINEKLKHKYANTPADLKAYLNAYVLPYYGEPDNLTADTDSMELGYAWLPVARINEITYSAIPEWAFDGTYYFETSYYIWALQHNESVINIPPEYAEREYNPDLHTAYLMQTDGFLEHLARLQADLTGEDITTDETEYNIEMVNTYGECIVGVDGMPGHAITQIEYDSIGGNPDYKVTLTSVMDKMSYIRHSADSPEFIINAYVHGSLNTYTWSYLSVIDTTSSEVDYGGQYYWGSYMLSASYIPYMSPAFDSYSYLRDLVTAMQEAGYDEWQYEDLENAYMLRNWKDMKVLHPAAYWAGRILDWKHELEESISYAVATSYSISEWEYKPLLKHMDNIYAMNVFNERSNWTDKFYGDMIPQSKVWADNNVLWVDPYNLDNVFAYENAHRPDHPFPYHDGTYIPEGTIYKDMYVKFLNKTHLFYWYIELFKDEKKEYDGTTDFTDFMYNKWYKNLYVAQDVWLYDYEFDGNHQGAPVRRRIYTPLEKLMQFPEYYKTQDEAGANDIYRSFNAFYNNIKYSEVEDVFTLPDVTFLKYGIHSNRHVDDIDKVTTFYNPETGRDEITVVTETTPIKFELCYRKQMIRADERLWDVSHMSEANDLYRDIYFYRIQSILEHDEEHDTVLPVRMTSDMSYLLDSLSVIDSYSYIKPHEHGYWREGEWITYFTYTEDISYFDESLRMSYDPQGSYIHPSDSMLIPMFDDIFVQPASQALVYTHYSLHDITPADIVSDYPDETTGEYEHIHTNYRFGQLDKVMMTEISDEEREKYSFTDTYDLYNECYPEMTVVSDDLGLGYIGLSTKILDDGRIFGFYYIKSYLNNTSNTFNVTGINENAAVSNLRYINRINGHSILQNPRYVTTVFKELAPFINQQLLSTMAEATTIIYPKTYPFDMVYSQVPAHDLEATETEIIKNDTKLRTMSLLRYFHAMTPIILPTTTIENEWRLKLKNVNAQLLETGLYISKGDTPIYSVHAHIDKFVPYTVYTAAYGDPDKKIYDNPLEELYTPVEYKFYNASRAVVLEPSFSVKILKKLTYDELLQNETDEAVFKAFSDHVLKRTHKTFSNDDLVFLLNKYAVRFDSVPVGLNLTQTEKLYELSIVFELL